MEDNKVSEKHACIQQKRLIPTLSLFTGAGGLDIGFHKAGYDIVGCVEIEEAYCKTLHANKNNKYFSSSTKIHCMDIRDFDPKEYADAGIECVIGGPPCQTFSAAGRRSGGVLGTNDQRGKLFEAYCYILSVLRPKVFVFENVYGLPGANGGEAWKQIVSSFSNLGYHLTADVLDTADYGVAQHRERLFIIGCLGKGFVFPEPTNGPDSSSGSPLVSVWDSIGDLQNSNEPEHTLNGLYGHLLPLVPEGLNYSFFTREMGYPQPYFAWRSKFHDFLYKVDRHSPCRTIKAQPGKFTGPFHWKNRHFTVDELKRLQSFPDDYNMLGSYTKIVEQIGNSVPPKIAEILAVSVREQLLYPVKTLTYQVRPEEFKPTFKQRQRERTTHYKKVAEREIAQRFSNVNYLEPRKKEPVTQFTVTYRGFFEKRISNESELVSEVGASAFSVESVRNGNLVLLDIKRIKQPKARTSKLVLNINGLAKYLISVDQVQVITEIFCNDDIFKIWDIIQERLTTTSQFFTLIDIYGHYANRGDTVKIETRFEQPKRNVMMRALEFFGNSENCGFFVDRTSVAKSLGIKENQVDEIVQNLRELRFDVRTSATHPTIRSDELICTYPFPLLSDKAQLERRLKA